MATWISNDVTVYGSQEEIMDFKAMVASDESLLDFNRIVPVPHELANLGDESAYQWKLKNWGTSTGPQGLRLEHDGDACMWLKYQFATSQSPAWGVYEALVKKFAGRHLSISWSFDLGPLSCEAGFLTPNGNGTYPTWPYAGFRDDGFYTDEEIAQQRLDQEEVVWLSDENTDARLQEPKKAEQAREAAEKMPIQEFFEREATLKARFERVRKAQGECAKSVADRQNQVAAQ
jgi:hypothetical protein